MKQFFIGDWIGAYYIQLQNSLGIIGMGNAIVNLTILWTVANDGIKHFFPWINYYTFVGAVLLIVLVILPIFDYTIIYRSRQKYLNVQTYKHSNPFKDDLEQLKADMTLIKKRLGVEE